MKEYRNKHGNLHREDGPAYETSGGTKEWYMNGQRHRLDGPAVEYADGTKYWYLDGELVYDDNENNLSQFDVSEPFKRSIIKYELAR